MNVLVADDHAGVLVALELLIEGKGHTVDTVRDGKSALELIKKKTYGLAFIDHDMPEMTGLELIEYLKKRSINIPVVMITGDKGMKEILARRVGAHEYIEKPYTAQAIENLLDKYSTPREQQK